MRLRKVEIIEFNVKICLLGPQKNDKIGARGLSILEETEIRFLSKGKRK